MNTIRFPIKSLLISTFIIYLTISTNYISLPKDNRKEILKHRGIQHLIVFLLAYLTTGLQTNRFSEKIISSLIVTFIFYSIT